MEKIINIGILRAWQNWVIVALVACLYIQATKVLTTASETDA